MVEVYRSSLSFIALIYCSGVYKGIRAVGRVTTEVTTGISIPDVCDTIDEIVEEDAEKK